MASVLVGIGSNVEAEANLTLAAASLRELFQGIRFSSVYETAPREVTDQPSFLNAVALADTRLTPEETLRALKAVEGMLGKATPFRFGPRTIDLDLLLYEELVLPDPGIWTLTRTLPVERQRDPLYLPHLRMHERRFVLEPLTELLNPASLHPVLGESWEALRRTVTDQECRKTAIAL